MRTTIWLSHNKDSDLITLYKELGKTGFNNIAKNALRAVVRGGQIERPSAKILIANNNEEDIRVNFVLTSEKDNDVKDLLSHVKKGQISIFIKLAIRFYIGPIATLSNFLLEDYAETLKQNIVSMQILAIGDVITKTPQKKKRKVSVKKQVPKKHKEVIKKEPIFTSQTNNIIPDTPLKEKEEIIFEEQIKDSDSNLNEEDEMLAMLESLLS